MLSGSLIDCLIKVMRGGEPKHEPTDSYFYPEKQLAKCMMRSDALNLHICPVRIKMTDTKQIPISHVCYTYKIKPEEFRVNKTLPLVYSTDEEE